MFGTADSGEIASALSELCLETLGSAVVGPLFYEASVGCVAGLLLRTGSAVVVKSYQPRWSVRFLSAVREVQAALSGSGFPGPHPLAGPVPLLGGYAMVESYLPDPGSRRATGPMLAVSAAGLADQVTRCAGLEAPDLRPHPLDAGGTDLYPTPHSPIFDFEATAGGAEWIDELATAAKAGRDAHRGVPVVAHCDWSARNVRMDDQSIVAVYDWDSLASVAEVVAVGQAAATWFFVDRRDAAPQAAEIASYVRRYEDRRGCRFSGDEHKAIGAAALYVLAYRARCEHAQGAGRTEEARAVHRLSVEGNLLLDLPALMDR